MSRGGHNASQSVAPAHDKRVAGAWPSRDHSSRGTRSVKTLSSCSYLWLHTSICMHASSTSIVFTPTGSQLSSTRHASPTHTYSSHLPLTPPAHTSCSHLVLTPPAHTSCSHLIRTPPINTSYSHLLQLTLPPTHTSYSHFPQFTLPPVHTPSSSHLIPPVHTSTSSHFLQFTPWPRGTVAQRRSASAAQRHSRRVPAQSTSIAAGG